MKSEVLQKTVFGAEKSQVEFPTMRIEACEALATFRALLHEIRYDNMDGLVLFYANKLSIFGNVKNSRQKELENVLVRSRPNFLFASFETVNYS